MLDSIYHMILKLLFNLISGVKKVIMYATLLWTSFHTCKVLSENLQNSLLFNFGNYFLFGKYQVLLLDRKNIPLAFFGQHNLFLEYLLSTKPYTWHMFCS